MDESKITRDISAENNFDFLRFLLAISVFCTHYDRIFGEDFINFPISISTSVSAFFVISGMLIYRSCLRSSSLKSYWMKRARRILPAYVLIVLLVIFLFAPFSDWALSSYFFSMDMVKYLGANLTTLNFLHAGLPGVLDGHTVNPSLWTIKIELFLYLLTPLFVLLFAGKRRWMVLLMTAVCSLLSVLLRRHADMTQIASFDLVGKWCALVVCFMVGVSLYLYRDFMEKYKWLLLVPSLLLFCFDDYVVDFFRPFAIAVCLYVAAFALPCFKAFKRVGDLSYGIYLYHGPIVYLTICLGWGLSLRNFLLTLSAVLLVSFLSWHLWEKKFLGR